MPPRGWYIQADSDFTAASSQQRKTSSEKSNYYGPVYPRAQRTTNYLFKYGRNMRQRAYEHRYCMYHVSLCGGLESLCGGFESLCGGFAPFCVGFTSVMEE